MTTFAELRRAMTPPTADQVANAFKDEISALAEEFTFSDTEVLFFHRREYFAKRLALAVLMDMHGHGGKLSKLLRAFDAGEVAAFPAHQDNDEIESTTAAFLNAAEEIAAEWLAETENAQ